MTTRKVGFILVVEGWGIVQLTLSLKEPRGSNTIRESLKQIAQRALGL